jgi:hypothetical protein
MSLMIVGEMRVRSPGWDNCFPDGCKNDDKCNVNIAGEIDIFGFREDRSSASAMGEMP